MRPCPSCGAESPDGFRFCGTCGAALETEAPGLEERRVVTVLFADLVGFTSRAHDQDPEDVRRMLAPYYARLRRELVRVGGTVEKFIGDAVMALFGAPVAHEDDPERAVRAALAIRDALAELAETGGATRLNVRIGITTGEAVFALGVAPHEGERIVADFVNVASRLQAAAPIDGILVGEATYQATRRAIEYRPVEAVSARGIEDPVPAWEALAVRARIGVDPFERGRVPLVGRIHEVQLLCDAFARTRRERSAQLVTLVGQPGIGKSRLVFELQSVVEDDPDLVSWRRGTCLPYGEGITFWPLAEIVKAQAGLLESDPEEAAESKLAEAVRDVVASPEEARRIELALRPLVGLAREGEDGREDGGEVEAAWRRFLEALAERNPTVLVFEDLHWADDGLLDFIDHLVDWATGVPLLVVCTARSELLARRSGWGGGKPNAVTVSLSPLSDDETARLLAELLDQSVMPTALQAKLLQAAGGNPLYAEEFVRMIQEHRDFTLGGELPLPETVQGIIAARLDALPLGERAVLEDAAVIGRVFWLGALERIARVPRDALEARLRSLERKQLVRRQQQPSVAGEVEFAFRHLLVQDVAYGRIPRLRRAEKHQLAAEWLQSLGRPEGQADLLAHHYLRALELQRATGRTAGALEERARRAMREAADRAYALRGFPAASRLYEAALGLWPRTDPAWPELRFRAGRAAFYAEEGGHQALAEARDALLAAGDRETAAEAESLLGQLAFRAGERPIAHYERALGLLVDAPPSPAKARVLADLSRSLIVAGQIEEGLGVARQAFAMAESLGNDEVQAKALLTIADARIELGDLGGMVDYQRGIELAAGLDSPEAASGYINLADTVTDLGDLARARELRSEAQRAAERAGDVRNIRWLRAERAGEAYWWGEWDAAIRLADDFIAESERGVRHYQETYCRVVRGRIRLARGDVEGALDDAGQALELARNVNDPQALFPTLALRARTLIVADRAGEAAQAVDELLALVHGRETMQVTYLWVHDLAVALADLDRGPELLEATANVRKPTPWLEAARLIASGDPAAAARIYARIGALPDEALARLRAATVVAETAPGEAESQRAAALAFYRAVGAPDSTGGGPTSLARPA